MNWQGLGGALGFLTVAVLAIRASPAAKVVLWSPMKGRVLLDGQPAAGAVLVRRYDWAWGNKQGSDRAIADADGVFEFPAIHGRMVLGHVLPHEPVTRQEMTVEYLGATHFVWYHFNHSYSRDAENGGRPIVVTCRLDSEPREHGEVLGRCEFE